jgi:hypothetical protein
MALGSVNVNRQPIILERDLTNAFVLFSWIDVAIYPRVVFYIDYKMGDGETANQLELKVEFSSQALFGYQQVSERVSGANNTLVPITHKFTAVSPAGTFDRFILPVDIAGAKYMRVSIKENGVATNFGRVAIDANFGWD